MNKSVLFAGLIFVCFSITGCREKNTAAAVSTSSGNGEALTVGKSVKTSVQKNNDGDFTVVSFNPENELPSAVKYPSIYVQFSEPAAALESLGIPSSSSQILKIEPPLKGVYRWYGTSVLSFDSEDEVIPHKKYTVTVNPNTKSLSGKKISGETVFSFKTEEIKLLSIIPGYTNRKNGAFFDDNDVPVNEGCDIAVVFSSPVNIELLKEYLQIHSNDSQFSFSVSRPKTDEKDAVNIAVLTPEQTLPENTEIFVTLQAGARSDPDEAGTSADQSKKFRTIQPFIPRWTQTEMQSTSDMSNPVYIQFSHPLRSGQSLEERARIAALIKTEPPMMVTAENILVRSGRLTIHSLPVTFGQSYRVTVMSGIEDMYGRTSQYPFVLDVKVPNARSYADFKNWGICILEAQFDPKLIFEMQNITRNSSYFIKSLTDPSKYVIKNYAENMMQENIRYAEVVDLSPVLNKTNQGLRGTVQFSANIETKNSNHTYTINNEQFVQVSDLGITARYGANKAVFLVSKLSTGLPVPDAELTMYCASYMTANDQIADETGLKLIKKGRTDADGFGVIQFAPGEFVSACGQDKRIFIKAAAGGDSVLYNPDSHELYRFDIEHIDSVFTAEEAASKVFIFTDRHIYKPGETITFRGIDRTLKDGNYSVYHGQYAVEIRPDVWRAEKLVSFSGNTSDEGGFHHSWKIPEDAKPTEYLISYKRINDYSAKQREHNQPFTVQFFERRRFQSSASIPDMVYVRGGSVESSFSASYLGGGSLGGGFYNVDWYMEPIGFSLPNTAYDSWKFGPSAGYEGRTSVKSDEGSLSDAGSGFSSCTTGSEKIKGLAYHYQAEVRITDAANQMISTSSSALVHPGLYYIGIGPYAGSGFPGAQKEIDFPYALVDPQGRTASELLFSLKGKKQQLSVELLREEWKVVRQMSVSGHINSRYIREFIPEMAKKIPMELKSSVQVRPEQGGSYILRLSSYDSRGNEIITERRFYVSGSGRWYNPHSDGAQISITADKDIYQPGQNAKLLLRSDLPRGLYMITVEREGIIEEYVKQFDTPSSVIEIPIKESYVPVVYVCVSSYSVRTREPDHTFASEDLDKPKGYFGITALKIDTASVRFDIDIKTDKLSYRPGEKAVFTLSASQNGAPVKNAEIVLLAVDRGVIDIVDYHIPDPSRYFYDEQHFPIRVGGGDSRQYLIDPVTYEVKNLVGGDADDSKMQERKNFNPTAFFVPSLITDEKGIVQYEAVLQDTLTEYRVTAVGIKENVFAKTETPLIVNNPVSVRQVLPRRLRKGDQSQAGVVVSNLDSVPHQIKISLKTGTAEQTILSVIGEKTQTVTVRPDATVSVMFQISAAEAGTSPVEFTVAGKIISEKISDIIQIERPILRETVTTAGRTDNETAAEAVILPDGKPQPEGSLSVSIGPSMLSSLSQAVDYVFNYPFGCLEQRSSAVLPLIYFGEHISLFGLDSLVKDYKKTVYDEISSWTSSQLKNGGFPYWKMGSRMSLETTMRIAEVLAAAQKAGIPLPDNPDTIRLAIAVENGADEYVVKHGTSNPAGSLYVRAYADYVLALLKRDVPEENLQKTLDNELADIEELVYTALAYYERGNKNKAAEIAQKLKTYTRPTVRGVDLSSRRTDSVWSFFGGKTEQYALMLKLFSLVSDNKDFIDRCVYELQQLQKSGQGRWRSTAQTARVLDAFNTYIHAANNSSGKISAKAYLDGKQVVSESFSSIADKGISKTFLFSDKALSSLKRGTQIPVVFEKKGKGTLFYTVSMTYEIPVEKQMIRDEGIGVFIEIFEDLSGKKVKDGALVQNGMYRAEVTVMTNRDRTFTALRTPVPSGCEILSAPIEQNWYDQSAVSNRYIYDNEIQYFWDFMAKGIYRVEFKFRAVRNGTYPTPPVSAECMYEPEIFGRTAGMVYTVEQQGK